MVDLPIVQSRQQCSAGRFFKVVQEIENTRLGQEAFKDLPPAYPIVHFRNVMRN